MKRFHLEVLAIAVLLLVIVPVRAAPRPQGPSVGDPVVPHVVNVDLRTLPVAAPWRQGDPVREATRRVYPRPGNGALPRPAGPSRDPLLVLQEGGSQTAAPGAFSTPALNFEGISYTGVRPPDTVGDAGPNHYIQMVNDFSGSRFIVYDKSGSVLAGPTVLSTLWTAGGNCSLGHGDPIVLYDQLADRWLMSEFSDVENHLCVYVSQTGDPVSGGWYLYDFPTPEFPDYPKYAVWPDAYYVSSNESSPAAYALDRTQMLNGLTAASPQRFTATILAGFPFQALIPSDLDGATPPPGGAPNYFLRHRDDEVHNAGSNDPTEDYLEVWEFHVDWATPANSTFSKAADIAVSEFDSDLCGLVSFNCFPQPGTSQTIDPIREVAMWRLQYRNFGSHETLVGNFVTDVDGTDHGGIRWFELRKTGAGPWTLHQEGTYAPDAAHRWLGSIAMDQSGNIALGYSVSSSSVYPSIRYVGRLAGDPASTLPQGEYTIMDGSGSQTSSERWGDYSAMSVDPADDCTFWYTNEYIPASGNWRTRIATFKFPECGAGPDFTVGVEPASQGVCIPDSAVYTVTVGAVQGYSDTVTLSVFGNPAGTSTSFSANPVTPPVTPTLTISVTGAAAPGAYSFDVVGMGPTRTHTATVQLNLIDTAPAVPSLTAPADGGTGVGTTPAFAWTAAAGAESYDIEIATDLAFGSVVASATGLEDPAYTPGSALGDDTVHYWRVRANNACGSGSWSAISAFRTRGALSCADVVADGGFEKGPYQDWSEASVQSQTIVTGDNPRNGTYSARMGGVNDEVGQVWQTVTIPASAFSATLRYWYEIDSTDYECGYDYGYMRINSVNVHTYDLCTDENTGGYVQSAAVDVSGYKGTSPEIRFRASTDFVYTSDLYVDDVMLEVCEEGATTAADYSDLPTSYGVAWHTGGGALRLGAAWDVDTSFADGDDDGSDDGVAYDGSTAWKPGQTVTITVNVTGGAGYLVGWFDWNDDGDFADAGEKAIAQSVGAGANAVPFTVPPGAGYAAGRQIDARFRLYASDPGGSETPEGSAGGGEVEDYTWGFGTNIVVLPLVLRDAGG